MSRRRHTRSRSKGNSPLFRFLGNALVAIGMVGACVAMVFGIFWWMGDAVFRLETDKNIVFVTNNLDGKEDKIIFIHFSPSTQNIEVFPIDPTQTVTVLGGYGEYQLSKVFPLLKLEKKDDPYMSAAMSWAMGVVVDQVVPINEPRLFESKGDVAQMLRAQIYRQGLHVGSARNLAELYFFTRSVPDELVNISTQSVSTAVLPDLLVHQQLHPCTVAVVNTTSVPKLATTLSTIFEQTGMTVVLLDDTSSPYQASTVSVDLQQDECRHAAERISAAFPQPLIISDIPELRQEHRADVVVMVGQDMADQVE